MTRATPRRYAFYLTPDHDCAYLAGRVARTVFADPEARLDARAHTALAAHGFRRSGRFVYRPACAACQACVPVRIPVDAFIADRGQRRTLAANRDILVRRVPLSAEPEHLALFGRYQAQRHPDGAMQARDGVQYLEYFASDDASTSAYEMREDGALLGVMVVDHLEDALSAVYTYFEPELGARSLGTFAILWQIAEAQRLRRQWLYLGYWIAESPRMAYKARFRPLQRLRGDRWEPVE